MAPLSEQAMEQLASDPMGVLSAALRMKQLLRKDTVYGIIGDQILKRTRRFASRERVISLMGKATRGMDKLTDFPETPWRRPGASRRHEGGDRSCRRSRTQMRALGS